MIHSSFSYGLASRVRDPEDLDSRLAFSGRTALSSKRRSTPAEPSTREPRREPTTFGDTPNAGGRSDQTRARQPSDDILSVRPRQLCRDQIGAAEKPRPINAPRFRAWRDALAAYLGIVLATTILPGSIAAIVVGRRAFIVPSTAAVIATMVSSSAGSLRARGTPHERRDNPTPRRFAALLCPPRPSRGPPCCL